MSQRALAIDTSTPWGGVALVEGAPAGGPSVVAELGLGHRGSHAADLLPRVEALLALAGWSRSSLDVFVACRGPGSFTGLRIGLGTIRGWSVAAGRPAVGVGTLLALAEAHGPAEAPRLPLLDAGRGELYGACYDAGGSPPVERVAPGLVAPAGIGELAGGGAAVFFGPGAAAALAAAPSGLRIGGCPRGVAAAAGRLAILAPPDDPETTLSPVYVRPPDALVGRPKH